MVSSIRKRGSSPVAVDLRRFFSTSEQRPGKISRPSSPRRQICSAASRVQPPGNTETLRKIRRSGSPSNSWLQSISPRSVRWRAGRSRGPSWSRSSLLLSLASRACGLNTRTRMAANSMARGRPSRRTHISATASAFPSSSAKSGRTAAARCANSSTGLASLDHRQALAPHGQPQRRHREQPFSTQAQGFPAGGQHLQPGAARQELGHLRGRRQQVLEVVQQHKHLLAPQVALQRLQQGVAVAADLPNSQRRADGPRHLRRLAQCRQVHEEHPVLETACQPGGRLQREPRLARAGGAGQRQQAGIFRSAGLPAPPASSSSRPMNGVG